MKLNNAGVHNRLEGFLEFREALPHLCVHESIFPGRWLVQGILNDASQLTALLRRSFLASSTLPSAGALLGDCLPRGAARVLVGRTAAWTERRMESLIERLPREGGLLPKIFRAHILNFHF